MKKRLTLFFFVMFILALSIALSACTGLGNQETAEHTHQYGKWTVYGPPADNCEDNIYCAICMTCNEVGWKYGTEN